MLSWCESQHESIWKRYCTCHARLFLVITSHAMGIPPYDPVKTRSGVISDGEKSYKDNSTIAISRHDAILSPFVSIACCGILWLLQKCQTPFRIILHTADWCYIKKRHFILLFVCFYTYIYCNIDFAVVKFHANIYIHSSVSCSDESANDV